MTYLVREIEASPSFIRNWECIAENISDSHHICEREASINTKKGGKGDRRWTDTELLQEGGQTRSKRLERKG